MRLCVREGGKDTRYSYVMAISFNAELLNRHFAPGISRFTTCDAPDMSEQHPQAPHSLANHFLNAVLRNQYKDKFRLYASHLIYRAQSTFADYQQARGLTAEFLNAGKPDNPAIRKYFGALARWESCLLNLQIFIDVMNKMKGELNADPVFKKNNGTPEERAYSIANRVKHFGDDISSGLASTIPMWLTNAGFRSRSHELTYEELGMLVSQVANVADSLQDPLSFAKPDTSSPSA